MTQQLLATPPERASVGGSNVFAQGAVGDDIDGGVSEGEHEGDVHDLGVDTAVNVQHGDGQPAAHEDTPHDGQLPE